MLNRSLVRISLWFALMFVALLYMPHAMAAKQDCDPDSIADVADLAAMFDKFSQWEKSLNLFINKFSDNNHCAEYSCYLSLHYAIILTKRSQNESKSCYLSLLQKHITQCEKFRKGDSSSAKKWLKPEYEEKLNICKKIVRGLTSKQPIEKICEEKPIPEQPDSPPPQIITSSPPITIMAQPPPSPPSSRVLQKVGINLMVAGGAAIVTSAVLMALNNNPSGGTNCTYRGFNDTQCAYNFSPIGTGLGIGLGGAAIVGGGIMLIIDAVAKRPTSAPGAAEKGNINVHP